MRVSCLLVRYFLYNQPQKTRTNNISTHAAVPPPNQISPILSSGMSRFVGALVGTALFWFNSKGTVTPNGILLFIHLCWVNECGSSTKTFPSTTIEEGLFLPKKTEPIRVSIEHVFAPLHFSFVSPFSSIGAPTSTIEKNKSPCRSLTLSKDTTLASVFDGTETQILNSGSFSERG